MTLRSNRPYADRVGPPLLATFTVAAGTTKVIQLDFYCRQYTLINNSGLGFPVIRVGGSRQGVEGVLDIDSAFIEIFPGAFNFTERFFWRDDEGPAYIFCHAPGTNAPRVVTIEFEYYPTKKRDGDQPMPTRSNRDFPTVNVTDAMVIPGI